ncbi:MAG: hypothetical protein QW304_00110 [Thermoproteota archaeon]
MMGREKHSGETGGLIIIAALWTVQSVGRLYFAAVGKPGGMGMFLDVPVSYEESLVMFTMFLLLGVSGIITVIGLLARRKWGFWITVFTSVATIVFDIWGVTIQYTAALGFIVPAVSLIYLTPRKTRLLAKMK